MHRPPRPRAGSDRDPRLKNGERKRLRAAVRAERIPHCGRPDCKWPGVPIDYDAPAHSRFAFDLDEIVPVVAGGDPLNRANVRPAHASCNRAAGARLGNSLRGQPRPAARPTRPALILDDW